LLNESEVVFLFVAHDVRNTRKGMRTLIQAFENLPNKSNLVLMVLGQTNGLIIDGIRVVELGFVTDKAVLRNAFLAADVFLIPSIAENFPNTIVESLLMGTPVIASCVGGIPEQINESNGILVHSHDHKAWTDSITCFTHNKNQFDRVDISSAAKAKYDSSRITSEYIKVYNSFKKN
jgi:glycosyltransferase involved in cell wall biosynthesis